MAAKKQIEIDELTQMLMQALDGAHVCKQEGVIATLVEQQKQTAQILSDVKQGMAAFGMVLNGTPNAPGLVTIADRNRKDIGTVKGTMNKIIWMVVTPSAGLTIGAIFYLILSHGVIK